MISDDSGPAPFDDRPHRRSGERRLEALANNALLKVMQFVITGVALPAIGFGISAVLTRMDKLEQQFQAQHVVAATTELRMLQAEKAVSEATAAERNLRDRVLALEYQTRGYIPPTGK